MARHPDLPEVNEFLRLKSRVVDLVEAGQDPSRQELQRLRSLVASLWRAGINPEELFHQRMYRTNGDGPADLGDVPENILRTISRSVVFNRIVEAGEEGYPSHIETLEEGRSGLSHLIENRMNLCACGRIAQPAGLCSVCSKFMCPEHVFSCHSDGCHIPLCFRDVFFFPLDGKNVPLCKKHFRRWVRRMDLWELEDKWRGKK